MHGILARFQTDAAKTDDWPPSHTSNRNGRHTRGQRLLTDVTHADDEHNFEVENDEHPVFEPGRRRDASSTTSTRHCAPAGTWNEAHS